jgi:hypothetical protein
MIPRTPLAAALATALALLAPACGSKNDGPQDGTLDVRIYGEELVEEGIPEDVFADGWHITWDRFIVALDEDATAEEADTERYLFDLTAESGGAGNKVATLTSASGMAELAYRIGPGDAATAGNADDMATMMEEEGWSIYVSGRATNGPLNLDFAWGFSSETEYSECEVEGEVLAGETLRTLVTIHADHLFYDDLDDDEPDVRFDLVATADADMDLVITGEELRAVDITADENYQVGSRDIDNLYDFIEAQTQTLGHIDGEGHCKTD